MSMSDQYGRGKCWAPIECKKDIDIHRSNGLTRSDYTRGNCNSVDLIIYMP